MSSLYATYQERIANLPAEDHHDFNTEILKARQKYDAIIVLDDDPTGTQTVYDIPILTSWDEETIKSELLKETPVFYVLTNSRSMVTEAAEELAETIGSRVKKLSASLNKKCLVVSRSDSTLRGHYPSEVVAFEKGFGIGESIHFIIPAFFEGGRYTIDDVHYVRSADDMIPAAETPFAKDKVFGFAASNLKAWVEEKTAGKVKADKVHSIGIDDIRGGSLDSLLSKMKTLKAGDVCIVNAASYADLSKVAYATLNLTEPIIYRTAASFVAALVAQPKRALLTSTDLKHKKDRGGIVVVGSYVPKTTEQLNHLRKHTNAHVVTLDVEKLLNNELQEPQEISKTIDAYIQSGQSVIICTSRKLISVNSAQGDLDIGRKVSNFLCEIVANLSIAPGFIVAKGGITSSDIATKALRIKRAVVQGQIIAGVPVWETGDEARFKELPYIIFPGNVGQEHSVTEVMNKLTIH